MSSIISLLRFGFSVLLVFIIAQSSLLYWMMGNNTTQMDRAVNGDFATSILISQMAIEGNKLRRYEKEFFIYVGNEKKLSKYKQEWQESYDKLESMLNSALKGDKGQWSKQEIQEVENWQVSLESYGSGFKRVMKDVFQGKITDTISANSAIVHAKERFKVLLKGTAVGGELRYKRAKEDIKKIDSENQFLGMVFLVTMVIGVLITLSLFFIIPKAIKTSINSLSISAEKMSKGDLEYAIDIDTTKREFRSIAKTLERMRISQKTFLQRIKHLEEKA